MKKIAFALLMSASSSYALSLCPNRSEGFLEFGLGYGSVRSSVRDVGVAVGSIPYPSLNSGYLYSGTLDISQSSRQKGFLNSYAFGYNANFRGSPLMVGVILGVNVGTVRGKVKAPITVTNNSTGKSFYYAENYTWLKSKFGAQAAIRLGMWWHDNLPFFKVGWSCLRTSFNGPKNAYPVPTIPIWFKGTRRFFNGLVLGIGWDKVVRKHCAVGLAADVTLYGHRRCTYFKDRYQAIVALTRPVSLSFMATIKYLLPENKAYYE